ncbi:MAG: leucine-rich repeat protein [Bacteroidales bacterium]
MNINRSGVYRIIKPMSNGCDSIINLSIYISPLMTIVDGDSIYFNIISNEYPRTVEVTYLGMSPEENNEYRDTISIPPFFVKDTIIYNVVSIGSGAFGSSYNLKWVNLPNTINVIGDISFNNCHNLKNLILPNSLNMIGYAAFENTELENLYIQTQTPPFVHWYSGINQSVNLYVLCGTKQLYQTNNSWNHINKYLRYNIIWTELY